MNNRSQICAFLCLIGLLASLLLSGAVATRHCYLARGLVTGFPEPVADAAVSTLGVNAALQQYRGDRLAWAVDLIADGGFHWVRQVFPWQEIEPAPGEYHWAAWDRVVTAADERGLQLIAVLHTAPAWAQSDPRSPHPFGPPADPASFAAFAAAFAARYGDRVDYYQVWDEPNLYDGWGGQSPDVVAYTALLCATADAIRAADRSSTLTAGPEARILLAGLAPTIETGPRNLSDHLYLRALYQAGATPCFDVVAAKPYGFDTGPDDRRVAPELVNFSRLLLLREEMEAHDDAGRAIWAVNWGWNALPNGWGGQPSIWGQTDETTQAKRTVAAIERAWAEWPWMGAMILENLQPVSTLGPQFGHVPLTKDPRWGFALVAHDGTPRPVYDAVKALITGLPVATPGVYPASTELATFVGYWELNPPGASAMTDGDAVSLPFEGTGVALTVARSPYLGYLYVTVDGQPANALPRDPQGRAYAPLYGALGEATTIPLATGLPQGRHTAVVTAAVGGGGWWLVDWRVARERDDAAYQGALVGVGTLALLCVAGVVLSVRRAYWGSLSRAVVAARSRLSAGAQVAQTVIAAAVFCTSAWTVWYERAVAGFHRLGDTVAIIATLIAATTFYFSPWLPLTLVSGLALAALILLRLDLGLPLVAAAAPFYLYPRALFGKAFSMVEILTLLCALSWGVRQISNLKSQISNPKSPDSNLQSLISGLDCAVIFFVGVATASLFVADYRHVALRELRVLILEPALFYLMLRTARLDGKAVWRVVDFFVLGAVIVALIGLVQYAFCDVELVRQTLGDVIRAEHDFRRLRSVYGSPNSVGLYLGRVLPLLVAVALFGASRGRRIAYGLTAIPVGLAILLSFSKGALMLGVPLSILALGVLAGGRWLWAALGTVVAAATAAIPLLRTPRFAPLFDTQSGTLFFRLHLWRSSWTMFWEHPWLGVGPDNFLYHYRGRYILPAAWEEPHLSQAHNVLLDYGTRMGIAGLLAGAWLQIAFWRLALPLRRLTDRDHRGLALGLMASMVNFLAHGLVDASYFLIDLAFAFFLTLVVVQWLARSETGEF